MSFRLPHWRAWLLLAGLLLASACTAQSGASAPYTDGVEYVTLPAPHQRLGADGKVEVVEVFSYGCVHCAHFAPEADDLAKSLPKGATFKLVPAVFSQQWLPYARAFVAARKLGVLERTHLALFKAKFVDNYPINTFDELADFYAGAGVDRAAFVREATSEATTEEPKHDRELTMAWQVDGTPTIVVDGKYRVAAVHSFEEMVAVTRWLVERELAARRGG